VYLVGQLTFVGFALTLVGCGLPLAQNARPFRRPRVALVRQVLSIVGIGLPSVRQVLSIVGIGLASVRQVLSKVGSGLPQVRDALAIVGVTFSSVRHAGTYICFRTLQPVELHDSAFGTVPSGQGAVLSSLHTFVYRLVTLSSRFITLQSRGHTLDGGIPPKQSRLHPGACLSVFQRGIPHRSASLIHNNIIARIAALPR
jgi:hypothetical protein